MRLLATFACMVAAGLPAVAGETPLPIFDAHIHYSQDIWEPLPPESALRKLTLAGITNAVVSSTPTEGTERLYALAPERIVPFLRPYPTAAHRYTWFKDASLPDYVRERLQKFPYRGIGEFHVFGTDAARPVVREILELARQEHLALHAHTDVAGLESILQTAASDIPVIWAHGGFDVPVARLRSLLDRYTQLHLELSFREGITADGRLTPEWRALLTDHRRRFLVGMDTYVPGRWAELAELATQERAWLQQLPTDVANDIAHGNAARLFAQRAGAATGRELGTEAADDE